MPDIEGMTIGEITDHLGSRFAGAIVITEGAYDPKDKEPTIWLPTHLGWAHALGLAHYGVMACEKECRSEGVHQMTSPLENECPKCPEAPLVRVDDGWKCMNCGWTGTLEPGDA